MSEVLYCQNLTKRYGKVVALDGIDLKLESGKIIGLLGPNGSGKTTLIKLISGLLTPTSGSLTICGQNPNANTKKIVSYLPDRTIIPTNQKVNQILAFYQDFFEDFRTDVALTMLQRLHVSPDDTIKSLSKGNQEKVSLILAMSRDAKLYVLDEPIAAVDPAARDYIISTIINNYSPDSSVIISTHLIADIEQVLDDVIFLKNGTIELHKSVDDIREEYGKSIDELFREIYRW